MQNAFRSGPAVVQRITRPQSDHERCRSFAHVCEPCWNRVVADFVRGRFGAFAIAGGRRRVQIGPSSASWWPRWDSNPDFTDFEPVASASWTTGPSWWVSPDSNRDAPMEHSALQAGAANGIRLTPEPSYLRAWRGAWESNPVARERLAR